tara:strand:+ start:19179 stop:20111 length:933 start_codon:yes stop_codon:yes gene_type:complete
MEPSLNPTQIDTISTSTMDRASLIGNIPEARSHGTVVAASNMNRTSEPIQDAIVDDTAYAPPHLNDLQHDEPVPDAIIAQAAEGLYRISWKSNVAGIITTEPYLVSQAVLANKYPHILQAWEAKKRYDNTEAQKTERKIVSFARRFLDRQSNMRDVSAPQLGVACDQHLLPGMSQHWGELRRCELHPEGRQGVFVCKGCRVAHYALKSQTFDRQLIMARGARVPICEVCATKVLETPNSGHRGCVCDSGWTCFRCREGELEKLAAARKGHVEGRCGHCREARPLVRHVDVCLKCRQVRVYAAKGWGRLLD